jgi:hypothetical protein
VPDVAAPARSLPFRRLPLSCNRALVLDGLHFARQVELFPVERSFDLGELAAARERSRVRISWPVLFLKAYSAVIRQQPALSRAYVRWPWPHLVEQSGISGMLVVNRHYLGEDRLCWARFDEPDQQPLANLQRALDRFQTLPVEEAFRRQVKLSRLPTPLRRLLFWWNLNFVGAKRTRRLGTFTLTTLAGQGALNRNHQSFLTSSLTYGPLDESGRSRVTLLVDHRVLDGMAAAAALNELERVLQSEIAAELRSLAASRAA